MVDSLRAAILDDHDAAAFVDLGLAGTHYQRSGLGDVGWIGAISGSVATDDALNNALAFAFG